MPSISSNDKIQFLQSKPKHTLRQVRNKQIRKCYKLWSLYRTPDTETCSSSLLWGKGKKTWKRGKFQCWYAGMPRLVGTLASFWLKMSQGQGWVPWCFWNRKYQTRKLALCLFDRGKWKTTWKWSTFPWSHSFWLSVSFGLRMWKKLDGHEQERPRRRHSNSWTQESQKCHEMKITSKAPWC